MKNENETQIEPDCYLEYGGEWVQHEDMLVGNPKGLEKLKVAIDDAIKNGESHLNYGDFMGVKCLEDSFFINRPEEPRGKFNNFIGGTILSSILIIFIIGIVAIVKFIF